MSKKKKTANLSSSEPKQVVQNLFAAFERGDMQAVLSLIAEDVGWVVKGDPELMPWVGRFKSRDAILKKMADNAGATKNLKIRLRWMVSEGHKVLALINEKATVSTTGQNYEVDSLHVYTVKKGKIQAFEN